MTNSVTKFFQGDYKMQNSHNVILMLWLVFAPLSIYYVVNTWTMTDENVTYKTTLFFGNVLLYYIWLATFVVTLRNIMYKEIVEEVKKDLSVRDEMYDEMYDEIREQVEKDISEQNDNEEEPEDEEIQHVEPVSSLEPTSTPEPAPQNDADGEPEDEPEGDSVGETVAQNAETSEGNNTLSITVPL
jgi:hypothetical protein